ncbi:hypothetical protein PAGU2196_50550 [Pseudomonas sp. PAGU 2196]|uniref:hypothetical protein n=1 Tax=Pseudomonas sp. PAGU 2196 TaxID=2793997 RepID=UPI001EDD1DC8|nr:hypothetical protein [Pseudomonas sp. PAGU 2196]GHS84221.1 hypothetical protein PAGU2196_50550 [Pseudomonas sp. PAGU 2196]
MINTSHIEPIWLIKNKEIGPAFDMAMIDVRHRYWKKYNTVDGGRPRDVLLALNQLGARPFFALKRAQVEQLLTCCFSGNDKREEIVNAIIPEFPVYRTAPLISLLKLAFLRLWMEKKIILPLGWNCPIHSDAILDDLIQEHADSCPMLIKIRELNPVSSLPYNGAMTKKERDLRASGWMRLLVASNLHDAKSFTAEDARDLKLRSFGHKSELARFYTDDFSVFLANASNNPWMRDAVNQILAESREQAKQAHKLKYASARKNQVSKQHLKMVEKTRSYLEGTNHGIERLATIFSDTRDLSRAFRMENSPTLPGGLELLPEKVVNFCKMLNTTYLAYIKSRRLESEKNTRTPLYYLLAYCGPYLYKFFMNRDGNLELYPSTFNDFTCAIYITADADLLKEVGNFERELPETLISMISIIVEINQNTPDTQYQRTYPIDEFFDYIISQSAVIPNAEKVRNSFSPACYPKTVKRWGTSKKPIPRTYFSTFISMLYSLEYLTMHLNGMADGSEPGLVSGELAWPTLSELVHGSNWSGLWGQGAMSCESVDFNALNFSPIFYHNGKPTPFKYIPRFYRISDMHIDGSLQPRIIMNDVRSTLLMCETGIRQQHLLWLDKDRYANYVERNMTRPLAPLLVSTDKAHGEWTAIVSSRVIDILDRQSKWYERCTEASFQNTVWYNQNTNSKFGRLRPLFRLALTPNRWSNYDPFRLLLLCLQQFFKFELGDMRCPDIVWCKPPAGSTEEIITINDHSITSVSSITASTLTSDYTPHGLRAGFVSEAIKFLPPSIVGQWLTGQSEPLVNYYSVFDESDLGMTHQQMLCMSLMSNQSKLSSGDLPELAGAISKLNLTLKRDIAIDPVTAISQHRLMSLSSVKRESTTGLDKILAKEVSELAFNTTHICPFNNICPKEVLDLFGEPNCCSACPFAIRGVAHLPAISAKKDKYRELMAGTLTLIQQYVERKPSARISTELEQLESENDRFAREACLLEAIEIQLFQMYEKGLERELMVKDREEIVKHYERFSLPEEAGLLKRLIDVQNFPDVSSEDLSMKLAHLRYILLMKEGDISKLLGIDPDKTTPIATKVSAQISSMVLSGAITPYELFAVSSGDASAIKELISAPDQKLKLTHMVA